MGVQDVPQYLEQLDKNGQNVAKNQNVKHTCVHVGEVTFGHNNIKFKVKKVIRSPGSEKA